MIAIVAIDQNWGIGAEGQLLQPISPDLQRFRRMTIGKYLIYGSKTLQTYPGKKVLPDRNNFILSRRLDPDAVDGAEIFPSVDALLERLKDLKDQGVSDEEFIVGGGASIYETLLPYVDKVYLTRIDNVYEADKYFPNLEKNGFVCTEIEDWLEYEGIKFRYETWLRKRE